MTVEGIETDLNGIIGESGMDEAEREALAGVILEACNGGEPPIDKLARYTMTLDAIRWLLYVGKITAAQCGNLMGLTGELLSTDGNLIFLEENEEALNT